jgi:transcriptional regulator, ArsR family
MFNIEKCVVNRKRLKYNIFRHLAKYLNIERAMRDGMSLILKAIGDESRRRILEMLKEGDKTAGEIAELFDITKPSISHHLNILKQAGLVIDERKGQNIYYSLNTSVLEDVLKWFMDIMDIKIRKEDASDE